MAIGVDEKRDFRAMQQPTDECEGLARGGDVCEGGGVSFLWLDIVGGHL